MNKKSFRTLSSLAIAIATVTSGAYAAELEEVIVTAQNVQRAYKKFLYLLQPYQGLKLKKLGYTALLKCLHMFPI